MNVQSLAVLLRALRQGEPSPRATTSARPVASVLPVVALASEDGSAPSLRDAPEHLLDPGARERLAGQQLGGAEEPLVSAREGRSSGAHSVSETVEGAATPPHAGATVALSPGAALLGAALRNAPHVPEIPVIRTAAPLLDLPATDARQLAHALEHVVTTSGLFYESHLADWALSGGRGHALAAEPQATWQASGSGDPARAPPGGAPWHGETAPLVRQQLDLLEFGRLAWQGEVVPGMRARIEFTDPRHVDERTPREGPPSSRTFRTRIELDLPSLGAVVALVAVDDDLVTCRITADSTGAVERLAAAGGDLAAALQRRALLLASCAVDHEHD